MTDVATPGTGTDGDAVRPFTIGFPLEAVDDMRRRVAATRWPDRETVDADNLIHFNEVERGDHFAAWEQPQIFCEELRESFRSLR